jgi:methyl-accepting chemotaxis protein
MVDLKKIRLFDLNFNLVSGNTLGITGLPKTLNPNLLTTAKPRVKSARLQPLSSLWQHNGQPYYSTLMPFGGLSIKGYFEIITGPAHNLIKISDTLQIPVQIQTLEQEALTSSALWQALAGNDDNVLQTIALKDKQAQPILNIVLSQDMSQLYQKVGFIRNIVIASFIGLVIIMLIGSVITLSKMLFKPIQALANELQQVCQGNLNIQFKHKGVKELLFLSHALENHLNSYDKCMTSGRS